MKISNTLLVNLIILSLAVLITALINTFTEFRPVLDFVYFIETNNPILVMSLSLLISFTLAFVLFNRTKNKKLLKEKEDLFKITIHTVQDILQKSSARIQNIILDLEENNVESHIINETKACLDENIQLINILGTLDVREIHKHYDENLSSLVFKIKKTNS
ncbi:MAG: hypothetical protein RDU14_15095 [Melioribacteraceae bacterium]|nr:hypothetical protein [Melioribacteraceae bacterium]